jgi:hypothetical protein
MEKELQRTITLASDIKSDKNAGGALSFCDAKGVVQKSAELANSLGLSFSIWDISVHGHLELTQQGPHGSLLERWKDKSLVFLNQRASEDGGHAAAPFELLSLLDFDKALRLNNTKIYPVGYFYPVIDWPPISPSVPSPKTETFKDPASFISSLHREPPAANTLCKIHVGRYTHPFSVPPSKYFEEEWRAIKKHLEERFPKDRFIVQPRYALNTKTRYPLTGVQYDTLGEIVVERRESAKDSIILGTMVDNALADSPDFVGSKINAASLIAAMPNRQLAQVVVRFLCNQAPNQYRLEAMCGGLLKKIMIEADMAEKHNKAKDPSGIPVLDTFAEVLQAELGKQSRPDARSCAWIIAHMAHYSACRLSWKQALLIFGTVFKVSEIFDDRVAKIEKHLLRTFDKQETALYRQAKKEIRSSLRKEFADTSREEVEKHFLEGAPSQRIAGVSSWVINPYLR